MPSRRHSQSGLPPWLAGMVGAAVGCILMVGLFLFAPNPTRALPIASSQSAAPAVLTATPQPGPIASVAPSIGVAGAGMGQSKHDHDVQVELALVQHALRSERPVKQGELIPLDHLALTKSLGPDARSTLVPAAFEVSDKHLYEAAKKALRAAPTASAPQGSIGWVAAAVGLTPVGVHGKPLSDADAAVDGRSTRQP